MSGARLAFISVRVALALSIAATLVCCGYLVDRDVRLSFIDSFASRADLIGFPTGFLIGAGVLIVLNLPVAFAGQLVLVILGALSLSLSAITRMMIVGVVVTTLSILWWRLLFRLSSSAAIRDREV